MSGAGVFLSTIINRFQTIMAERGFSIKNQRRMKMYEGEQG